MPSESTLVEFSANAFRLVQDSTNEWFMDFLQYTEVDDLQEASVVARVRVPEGLLELIRDRLNDSLGSELDEVAQLLFGAAKVVGGVN